jgi:hypothetical protein
MNNQISLVCIFNFLLTHPMHIKVLTFRRLFISGSKVAKTSQGSSESIKTISIVTLLFLPGTGIAVCQNSPCPRSPSWRPCLLKKTVFSTPFFCPADSSFKVDIAPSFIFYWILTIPTTVVIMSFGLLWTMKLKPSAKDSALHELVRPPQRKSAMTSWREWIMMAKESRTEDMSILSSKEMTLSDLTVHILGLYT